MNEKSIQFANNKHNKHLIFLLMKVAFLCPVSSLCKKAIFTFILFF